MMPDLHTAAVGTVVAEYETGAITREQLAVYADASGDLNPLHLDPVFARKAGFADVIVHGMLGMALLGRLLSDNFPADQLLNFSARFAGIVPVGTSLRCRATLQSRDGSDAVFALEALDPAGTAVILGQARVALSAGSAQL